MPGSVWRRDAALALTVAVVLADSSVVTLGLPDILREFDTTVAGAAWVLIAFNVVLAAALPFVAGVARRHPGRVWTAGVLVLAAASLACALAPSLELLLAGRVLQAAGGAAVLGGAVAALAHERGSEIAGARVWGPAAVAGLAVGPAAGGLLTELLSWQAIFAVQVPIALLVLRPPKREAGRPPRSRARPRMPVATGLALALLSAALTAALFLLVILLTRGWEYSPLAAAAVVSVMAVATLAAGPLARRLPSDAWVAAAGIVAAAAGLAALGLLPDASWRWTVAPQVLIGLGLGLAMPVLTDQALAGGREGAAVATLWVRHAGIVLGLSVLVPLFSADLDAQEKAAQQSGTALLLEARLPPGTKIELGQAIADEIERAHGRLPRLRRAFDTVEPPEGGGNDLARLEARMQDEVERAATHAFSRSFLVAGILGVLALIPLVVATRGRRAGAGGRPA